MNLPVLPTPAGGLLAEMKSPEYLQLLGKGVGIGAGVGVLAHYLPSVAVPVAFLGGVYFALEMIEYMSDSESRPVIDATSSEVTP